MIGQSEYSTANNYGGYGSTSAYQIGSNTNALSNAIGITTLSNTINPYASSVIGSSNGYSKVLSLAGGGMGSVPSCYSLSSAQHLQPDKNGSKDRLEIDYFLVESNYFHTPTTGIHESRESHMTPQTVNIHSLILSTQSI